MKTYCKTLALALLCSVSLTGCWPKSDNAPQTKRQSRGITHANSTKEFNEITKDGNVVVDFYADWCGPCKRLGPILEDLAKERTDITFVKVNTDKLSSLSNSYDIRGIPALIFMKNGKEVSRVTGFQSKKDLRTKLNKVF